MATSPQILSANVKKLLIVNGWSYAKLAEVCKGKLSYAYINSLRHPDKINPSIKAIEIIAKAFNVTLQTLLNPNLEYDKATVLPEGYFRKEYLVDEFQDVTLTRWENINKEIIEQQRREKASAFK